MTFGLNSRQAEVSLGVGGKQSVVGGGGGDNGEQSWMLW